jgi:hypothetical protein
MLPPKELNTTCLRCKADMPPGERYCNQCGADRELELSVAGELHPAVGSLGRWLLALGVISLLLVWLVDAGRIADMSWAEAIVAFWPSFGLALGLLAVLIVLVGAGRAAWRARVLRAQAAERFPTAIARQKSR